MASQMFVCGLLCACKTRVFQLGDSRSIFICSFEHLLSMAAEGNEEQSMKM
jgi:hypothetical protein